MSYTSIIVHVRAGPQAAPRLACARELAQRFDATLIGLGAEMTPPLAAGPVAGPITAEYYLAVNQTVQNRLVEAKAAFDGAVAGLAKEPIWEDVLWFPGEAVATASRAADLIVASHSPKAHETIYSEASAAELVLSSGRPVLVVPSNSGALKATRILLAWKDTREARRAMIDAMPFFKAAQAVMVFTADPEDGIDAEVSAGEVVAALKRHGVEAGATVERRAGVRGEDIQNQAKRFGADLIVAGGYGRSRLGEWAFGGVTADLLAQDQVHVLLSH